MEKLTQIYASIGQRPLTSMSKPTRKSYKVTPCSLCDDFVDSLELRESVQWSTGNPHSWFDEGSDFVAHRRCWKKLPESRRREFRRAPTPPKSLGQFA